MRSTGCLNAGFGGFMTVAELVRSNDLCAHTIAALNGDRRSAQMKPERMKAVAAFVQSK